MLMIGVLLIGLLALWVAVVVVVVCVCIDAARADRMPAPTRGRPPRAGSAAVARGLTSPFV